MDSSIIIEKSYYLGGFELMLMAMYSTLAERKVAAWLQDRIGPNRAGAWFITTFADGLKLFAKEEFEPDTQIAFFFWSRIAMTTALMTSAVIPCSDRFHLFGKDIILQATDIDVALLYLIGVMSISVNYDWWVGI
jgi:NADH-quinone oxidoreductase subunit H